MKYFREIQKQRIEQTIIDAPVTVDELALLQDTVEKNVFGRIKFFNQSCKNIIAIFINLYAYDISGEKIIFEDNQFIYQDMVFMPGDIYGNKVAIELPLNTRKIDIKLIKIVFDDGKVWNANEAEKCDAIYQKEIKILSKNFEQVLREIGLKIVNANYVKYYYEENKEAWSCTCGKINSNQATYCDFCNNERTIEKENLTEVGFERLCNYVDKKVKEEEYHKKEVEKEKQYQKLILQMQRSSTGQEYRSIVDEFSQMKGYKDSEDRICQCQKKIDEILYKEDEKRQKEEERRKVKFVRNKKIAIWSTGVVILFIIIILVINFSIIPYSKYLNAKSLMANGHYEDAIKIFEMLDDYKDSRDEIYECKNQINSEFLSQVTDNIVACTENASYALKVDGTVLATGNNEKGQLNVDKWSEIIGIDAADDYAVGIKKDGSVISTKYIQGLDEWDNIIDISAGDSYLAGLKSDGTVVTIGVSEYTIGEKEDTDSWNDVIAISQGYDTLVGVKEDGTVIGCGSNYNGQLEIDKWCNIIQIDTSDCFTAGLRSDGTVVCTGYAGEVECDTSKWSDIKAIAVERWGVIGLKNDGSLVATGSGVDASHKIIPYNDSTSVTGLSIEGMSEVSVLDSKYSTICVKKDGTAIVVGTYGSEKQKEVSHWKDIVAVYPENSAIDKIRLEEVQDIEVNIKKSQAEKYEEERHAKEQKEKQARINKNADIHIGMDSVAVRKKLKKILGNSKITVSEPSASGCIDYSFNISNNDAADMFKVESVRYLPKIINIRLGFSNDKLEYIDLGTELPPDVSNTDHSKEYITNIIKKEAKKMGYNSNLIVRGQYGSSAVYRGEFNIEGVNITIYVGDKLTGMYVRLYDKF